MDVASDALHVSIGAILGVLTRVGLGRAFGPPGLNIVSSSSPLFLDLPANAVGSLLAGAFGPLRPRTLNAHRSLPHLVATGYLGSVTTFASWNLQVTRMLVDGDVAGGLFALVLGILVPLASFSVGGDITRMIGASFARQNHVCERPSLRSKASSVNGDGSCIREGLNPAESEENGDVPVEESSCADLNKPPVWSDRAAAVISGLFLLALLAASIGAYALDNESTAHESTEWRRALWMSCVLAPAGALARWQLSRLNGGPRRLPRGTLAANSLAALLDAGVAAGRTLVLDSRVAYAGLSSVITGAGGTLSTVSTWAGEIAALRASAVETAAYAYVAASLLIAQTVGLLVYGTTVWTG